MDDSGEGLGYSSTGEMRDRKLSPEQSADYNRLLETLPINKRGKFGGNRSKISRSKTPEDDLGLMRNLFLNKDNPNAIQTALDFSNLLVDPKKQEDPKVKAFRATEEYYKAIIDKPGNRQTRSPDLLMSNAFNGGRR